MSPKISAQKYETNADLQYIKVALIKELYPKKIYLFGSFARGEENEDSDYDLCLILDNNVPKTMEQYVKAYKAIRKRSHPVDIIIYNEKEFDEKKSKNSIEKKVEEEGVILYER